MIKDDIHEVINDLRARRDALCLAHEDLKANNDKWNGIIILLSLLTGMIESVKIKLQINNDFMALVPILMSSVVACISALIKFKKYPEQMEVLIQSSSLLTQTLTKARNHDELDEDIRAEYYLSLEKLETSLYPDLRKKYLKQSHKNLLCIMEQEMVYYNNIRKVNAGEKMDFKCDSRSDTSNETPIKEMEIEIGVIDNEILDRSSHRSKPLDPIDEV